MLRYLEVVGGRLKTMEICDANLVSLTYVGSEPNMLFKNVPRLFESLYGV